MDEKHQFLELIRSHIDEYGYHVTTVSSMTDPRYVYTIGLSELFDFELIFAGGIIYLKDELSLIFEIIIEELKKGKIISDHLKINIDRLGAFSLTKVDVSWSKLMMLGVFDYYKLSNIIAFQIVPDSNHFTLDIPDMVKEWNASSEPVWRWLVNEWNYPIPKNSTVITNIKALLGESITEITRWENDEWEMFTGSGSVVQKEDMRVVALATILAIDESILPAISLEIGKGLWRDSAYSDWNNWG